MGKVIVKGYGGGGKAILGWLVFYLASAVVSFWMAHEFGVTQISVWGREIASVRNQLWFIFIAVGVIEIVAAILIGIAISNTSIVVSEDGISGRGISKWFYFGDVRSFNFTLSFDEAFVDVNGEQIVVHALGTHYKVWASNASEIQQTIFKQKTEHKQASKSVTKGDFCSSCGTKIPEGGTFCSGCGAKVMAVPPSPPQPVSHEEPKNSAPIINHGDTWHCAKCNTTNPILARICKGCGKDK